MGVIFQISTKIQNLFLDDYRTKKDAEVQNKLAQFQTIAQFVLKTEKQKEDFHKLLQDTVLIQGTKDYLMTIDEEKETKNFESPRIDHLNFWAEALKWHDNPAKTEVISAMEDFILLVQKPPQASDSVKKAIVGDQVEAYMLLIEYSPDVAKQISIQAEKDPKLAKIIRFAKNFYKQQKGK